MAIDIYEYYRPKIEALARKYGIDERLFAENPDIVMVVRCKDCKHYSAMIINNDLGVATWGICTQPWFNSDEFDVQEADYCSYGERRTDKEK